MFCWTKSMRGPVLIACMAIAVASCESESPRASFYPIDSLLTGQIDLLTRARAGLFKEALLRGKRDTVTYTPKDTLQWNQELDIFRKLDEINKPVNKAYYRISDGLLDPASNLKVKAFTSQGDMPIAYLKVYYQGHIDKPRKIEALVDEKNLLYQSARFLTMHFQQIGNKTVLTSYSVKGGQDIIFGDTVVFNVHGKILVD